MKVVALGELLIDFSCRENNDAGYPILDAHPGGAPANYLTAIRKYGTEAAFIGKVGDDVFGRLLIDTLQQNDIDTSGTIISKDTFTTLAFVTFNSDNDREFSFARKPGADTCLKKEEVSYRLIEEADVFHFGTLSLTDEPSKSATIAAVEYAQKKGKIISFDPNLRKPLWDNLENAKKMMLWGLKNSDCIKISDEEIDFLFPGLDNSTASQKILDEFGAKIVFITLGKDGCFFRGLNGCGYVEPLKGIEVKDTTGAGDIFGGSAMHMILSSGKKPEDLTKEDLKKAVRFACAAAGLSTTRTGGIGSVHDFESVMRALNCNYCCKDGVFKD